MRYALAILLGLEYGHASVASAVSTGIDANLLSNVSSSIAARCCTDLLIDQLRNIAVSQEYMPANMRSQVHNLLEITTNWTWNAGGSS
jgi:hypothetical protein